MLVDCNSSLIDCYEYFEETEELTIYFKNNFPAPQQTFVGVPSHFFELMLNAPSIGKFYLQHIKQHFSQKKNKTQMADGKKIFKLKIDVTKINKDYLFQGKNGVYLNFTFLQRDETDQYGNNGMLVQDVPTEIYKAAKAKGEVVKGNILGNGADWTGRNGGGNIEEAQPGVETGTPGVSGDIVDDLPF